MIPMLIYKYKFEPLNSYMMTTISSNKHCWLQKYLLFIYSEIFIHVFIYSQTRCQVPLIYFLNPNSWLIWLIFELNKLIFSGISSQTQAVHEQLIREPLCLANRSAAKWIALFIMFSLHAWAHALVCECFFGHVILHWCSDVLGPVCLQLHGVDDNIGKSRKILAAMSKRMDRNKWIIGGVIAVLVLAIILILYFKLAH